LKDEPAKQRLDIMRKAIDDFHLHPLQSESTETVKFRKEPLLRYDDKTRPGDGGAQALLDATAWRLGETGRPLAIVTLEIYPLRKAMAVMTYEFVSLSPLAFEMKNSRGVIWTPSRTELTMVPLPEAPELADTKRFRLAQMRQLARRFTAQAGLLLERSEKFWSYGVFRLTAATLCAQFDGKSFDLPSKHAGSPVEAPTTSTRLSIDLPE
jgi:hypothetical protein